MTDYLLFQNGPDAALHIVVKAHGQKNEILGFEENGELKVRVRAIREKGKANIAVIELLSEYFDIPKSSIEIISGHTSSHKKILLRNYLTKALLETFKQKN